MILTDLAPKFLAFLTRMVFGKPVVSGPLFNYPGTGTIQMKGKSNGLPSIGLVKEKVQRSEA